MNATVMGGWVLSVAAVEALVNEILSQRFPDGYEEMELQRRRGFAAKLRRLSERLDIDPGQEWVTRIVEAHSSRSDLVHHKPRYLEDSRDWDSVEPLEMHDPQALTSSLKVRGEMPATPWATTWAGPQYLLWELLGRNSYRNDYVHVTDGGHVENLGLVGPAASRGPRPFTFPPSGATRRAPRHIFPNVRVA